MERFPAAGSVDRMDDSLANPAPAASTPLPGVTAASTPTASPPSRDRRAVLAVLGVVLILLGLGAWAMMGLTFLASRAAQREGGELPVSAMVSGLAAYGVVGALMIGLGMGSLRARRWARALIVAFTYHWSMTGLLGMALLGGVLPYVFRQLPTGADAPPSTVLIGLLIVVVGVLAIFFVALPLGLFFFYRGGAVHATCVVAQPDASWTDAVAFPLLAAGLGLLMMGLMLLPMPFSGAAKFPLFGIYVGGTAAVVAWSLLAVAALLGGVGIWRRLPAAWWLALATLLFFGASASITYARMDFRQLIAELGVDALPLEELGGAVAGIRFFCAAATLAPVLPQLVLLGWGWFHLRRDPPVA